MATRTRRPGTGPAAVVETEMTDVATTEQATAPDQDANGAATAAVAEVIEDGAEAKSAKNTAPIQITVPLDLKAKIKEMADAAGKTSARWVLENVAVDLGYELPAETRVATERGGVKMTDVFAKGLTPVQKKERLTNAKLLLDALGAGKIDLEKIKADLGMS